MAILFIVGLSALVQFTGAAIVYGVIRPVSKAMACTFTVCAVFLIASGHGVTLSRVAAMEPSRFPHALVESIELAMSIVVVAALAKIRRAAKHASEDKQRLERRVEERSTRLEEANQQLRAEIAVRKQIEESLQQARVEAEAADDAKSNFLAKMSHELRTPLNAIIGFSQVLKERYFGGLTEKQAEYVEDIMESGDHLLALLNDVLDLSKIEAGKMELRVAPVGIAQFVENCVILIRDKCAKHGIHLDVQVKEDVARVELIADERRLKQVMLNLLSNASKFTPDGGTICATAEKDNEEVVITVSDTGIGVAQEDQERIFTPFSQISSSSANETTGCGIGLSISKEIVKMHGGRIWVSSEGTGKGSTFSFAVPIKPFVAIMDRWIAGQPSLLNELMKVYNLSRQHGSHFALCRFRSDDDRPGISEQVKECLTSEKRNYDIQATDAEGQECLILRLTNDTKARQACERLRRTIEGRLGIVIFYSLAVYPTDGDTPHALVRKITEGALEDEKAYPACRG